MPPLLPSYSLSSASSSASSTPPSPFTRPGSTPSFSYLPYTALTDASFRGVPPTDLEQCRIDFIRYSPDFALLICTLCRYALYTKSRLKPHLLACHRQYVTALDDFDARLAAYDALPVRDARDLPTIEERTFYFPQLPLYFDTVKCPDCPYFSRSAKNARKHRIDVHQRRAPPRQKRRDLLYAVPAQMLFPHQNRGLFIPRLPEMVHAAIDFSDDQMPVSSSLRRPPGSVPSSSISSDDRYQVFRKKEADLLNQPREADDPTQNPRNISAFHRNSRLYLFPRGKDVIDLLSLLHDPPDVYQALQFEKIRKVAIDLQQHLSSRIPHLPRQVRQDVRDDGTFDVYARQTDLIELIPASRPKYFRVFADLFIFLLQLDARRVDDERAVNQGATRESRPGPRPPSRSTRTGREKNQSFLAGLTFTPTLTEAIRHLLPLGRELIMQQDDPDESTPEKLALQDALVEVLYQLLQIKIDLATSTDYTAFTNPAILFLVLRSITTTDDSFSFRNGDDLVKLARQLVYGTRLFFVGLLDRYERRERARNPDQPLNQPAFTRFYRQNLPLLHLTARNYLAETIANLRYMTKVLKSEVSTNRPVISITSDEYLIYGERYSLVGMKEMMADTFDQLKTIFWSDLVVLTPHDLPPLSLENVQDNAMNTTLHYYLADHPVLSTYQGLLVRLLHSPASSIAKTFIKGYRSDDQSPVWRKAAITRFYTARRRFLRLLLLAIHTTSGSPLRGEELVLLLFRNTEEVENNARHLVWDREAGSVRITTYWYKSQNINRKNKANMRFLPPAVSYLLVYYLIYVYPLYSYFNVEYLGLTKVLPVLFEDRGVPFTSPNLSRILALESVRHFRASLAINSWRHLINHVLRQRIRGAANYIDDPGDNDEDPGDTIDDSLVDLQANRSSRSGAMFYSLRQDLPSQVTNDLYFHTRQFSQHYFVLFELEKLDFGHGRTGRPVENPGTIPSGVNPTLLPPSRPQDRINVHDVVIADNALRIDINEAMTRFFGHPQAQFRDRFQRAAVSTVLQGFTYLTYVNKTGSGKSLLYLLPASLRQVKTVAIVITPRLSLRNDLLTRAQRQKIRAVNFADMAPDDLDKRGLPIANLVFVAVESIVASIFTIYLEMLKKDGYQVTIFLDEAHLLLLESNFRPVLKYVNGLMKFRCPCVFLTATLPFPLLRLLEREFFIQGHNTLIRGPTLRGNIVYRLEIEEPTRGRAQSVRDVIEKMKRLGLGPAAKAIIFIAHIGDGEDLADQLGLPFYHSSNPENETILASFVHDPTSLMIMATSALAVGVDFDIIGFTLHVPPYFEMISFIQESGRIRREGTAFILTRPIGDRQKESIIARFNATEPSEISTLEDFRAFDKLALKRLLVESRCYRRVLSLFFDNHDIVDCIAYQTNVDPEVKLCQLCEGRQQALTAVARAEKIALEQIQTGLTSFEEKLDELETGLCLYCLFFGPLATVLSHTVKTCQKITVAKLSNQDSITNTIVTTRRTMRERRSLHPRFCCFSCLLPARICNRLKEANNLVANDECIYPTLVVTGMIILYRLTEISSVLSFNPVDLRRKAGQGLWPAIEHLISPSVLHSTDAIKAVNYLNELDVETIISERENQERVTTSNLGSIESDDESGEEDSDSVETKNDERETEAGRGPTEASSTSSWPSSSISKRSRADSAILSPGRQRKRKP